VGGATEGDEAPLGVGSGDVSRVGYDEATVLALENYWAEYVHAVVMLWGAVAISRAVGTGGTGGARGAIVESCSNHIPG
jgi:hypothetical protein